LKYDKKVLTDNFSLPTYGYSRDGAYPHIEVDDVGFILFVIVEKE